MALFTEKLESRTLFAAASIPSAIAAAYNALIQDNVTLKADGKLYTSALTKDVKTLAAEVKLIGKSKTNAVLLREIQKDASIISSADVTDTSKFVGISNSIFRSTELAEATFTAKPNLANGHKLVAKVNLCDALQSAYTDPRFQPLVEKAANAENDLVSLMGVLANSNSIPLPAVTSMSTDLNNLSNIQADDAQTTLNAIQSLLEA